MADWPRAQHLFDEQLQTDWPTLLADLTRRCNPLSGYLDQHAPSYWTTVQSEWATDILFHSAADLSRWYERWLQHSVLVLNCRDSLRFLGQRLPEEGFYPQFTGEVKGDLRERREGRRAKLW